MNEVCNRRWAVRLCDLKSLQGVFFCRDIIPDRQVRISIILPDKPDYFILRFC